MRRFVVLASSLAAVMTLQIASAAPLHYPLPPDSTAQNGTPYSTSEQTRVPDSDFAAVPFVGTLLHPHAAEGLKRPYSGTPTDVLRYHNDNYPTGWNRSETDLTPATVRSASFGLLTTLNVDGNVLAQPLIVSNFQMPDSSTRNVLIVATGHNTVYAYDAQTYEVLWQRNLGAPQPSGDVGCFDILPGIRNLQHTGDRAQRHRRGDDLSGCRHGARASLVSHPAARTGPRHRQRPDAGGRDRA